MRLLVTHSVVSLFYIEFAGNTFEGNPMSLFVEGFVSKHLNATPVVVGDSAY